MSDSTNKTREDWYDECVALQQDGELAQAVSELKRLVEAHPDYGLARLALAVFAQQKGDEELALESMQKACELEQDDPFYFTAFSALAIKCGSRELAEEALWKAQEARMAAQMKKMSELRKKELADREERDAQRIASRKENGVDVDEDDEAEDAETSN